MPGHAHVVGAVPDGVTLHVGDRIVVTRGHLTRAATGEELSGPIILATGAIPRTVPSLADAHVLRTADDASRLRETLGGGGRGVDVVGTGTEPGAGAEHIVVVSEAEEFESVVVRDGLVIGAVAVAKRPNPRGIAAAVGHPWDR